MNTRKKYSREFKLDAIHLVREQGYTQAEAGRSLGINPNMLGRWIAEHEAHAGQAFRGNGKLNPEQAKLRRLREENRRLKMDKDILKKSDGLLREKNKVKYVFITRHKKTWPVDRMCRILGVSRNAYYRYCQRL